jgi:hypothetical protein
MHIPNEKTYAAMVYVDGEEFMGIPHETSDQMDEMFNETVKRVGGEVALMVWKPKYRIWFRERLSITASVDA